MTKRKSPIAAGFYGFIIIDIADNKIDEARRSLAQLTPDELQNLAAASSILARLCREMEVQSHKTT